jgi:hypothetical protein
MMALENSGFFFKFDFDFDFDQLDEKKRFFLFLVFKFLIFYCVCVWFAIVWKIVVVVESVGLVFFCFIVVEFWFDH